MADFFAVNATLNFNTTPSENTPSYDQHGVVRVINDTYEATGEAIGSDIIIGRVYTDERIQVDTTIYHDALGASSTLSLLLRTLDTAQTETVLIAATATSSAGIISVPIGNIDDFPAAVSTTSELILKSAGGTITGTIKSNIRTTVD